MKDNFNEWLIRNDFNDRLENDLDNVLIEEGLEEQHRENLNITLMDLE